MDTFELTTFETVKQMKRRRHTVNANQVFYWRKKYREGRLGKGRSSNLLPVAVSDIPWSKSGAVRGASSRCPLGAMEIKLPKGQLRITHYWLVAVHCTPPPLSNLCGAKPHA
jgi:hypothetical protein